MKKIKFNKKEYSVPTLIEELTFEQLVYIITQKDVINDISAVSFFLGIPQSELIKIKDIKGFGEVLTTLSELLAGYIDFEKSELPKCFIFRGVEYNVPVDIGDLNIETFEYCRSLLGSTNIGENTNDYLDVVLKITAYNIREIIKREEDVDDLFLNEVKQLKGLFVLNFGNFFLQKLNESINGIMKTLNKEKLTNLWIKRVMGMSMNVGGFFTNLKKRVISVLLKKKNF